MVLYAQPPNGPSAFLPRTLLLKVYPFTVRLFLSVKDTLTPWKSAFGLRELLRESPVLRVPCLASHSYQFPGNILRIIYSALDLHSFDDVMFCPLSLVFLCRMQRQIVRKSVKKYPLSFLFFSRKMPMSAFL